MTTDIKELKRLAEAATPGPWRNAGMDGLDAMVGAGNRIILWRCNGYFKGGIDAANADANYISAANPKTVVALIDHIEQLEGQLSAQTAVKTEQPSLTITLRQAEELVKFFGGHDCEVTVTGPLSAWGKTEPGLYAYCTEYPEDGASYLGKTEVDYDLAMHGRKGKTEQPGLSDLSNWQILLDWNRAQEKPPIVIGQEYEVAKQMQSILEQRQDSNKEPLVWESITPCFTRFVSDARYQKFSPEVRAWYRPVCEKCGGVANGAPT